MKAIILCLLGIFLFSGLAMADINQVVFTAFNISIQTNCTSVTYTINQEGINIIDTFPISVNIINGTNSSSLDCSGNYTKLNVPVSFSRVFATNETDMGILINALSSNLNLTADWKVCQNNLSVCMAGFGYRDNYTNLSTAYSVLSTQNIENIQNLNEKQTQLDQQNSNKWIFGIVGAVLGALAYYGFTYKKKNPTRIVTPQQQFPSIQELR